MNIERITHYHFKTKSKSIAKAIEIVARDHKARELLFYFDKIEKQLQTFEARFFEKFAKHVLGQR